MTLKKYYTGSEARQLCQNTVDEQTKILRKNLQSQVFDSSVFSSK